MCRFWRRLICSWRDGHTFAGLAADAFEKSQQYGLLLGAQAPENLILGFCHHKAKLVYGVMARGSQCHQDLSTVAWILAARYKSPAFKCPDGMCNVARVQRGCNTECSLT